MRKKKRKWIGWAIVKANGELLESVENHYRIYPTYKDCMSGLEQFKGFEGKNAVRYRKVVLRESRIYKGSSKKQTKKK